MMELASLMNTLDTFGHGGSVLNTEEGIILYNTLVLLQNENHFRKIYFWGRIYGVDRDYFVAFGYVNDALSDHVFYYSTNCLDWGLLPKPTEKAKTLTPLCIAKFQGDPATVYDILIEEGETSIEEITRTAYVLHLKEEDRLSCTVHFINEEAGVVPRGALFQRPDGVVIENLTFEGLDPLDAQEITCYLHYRKPRQKWNTNLLTRSDYNYALDFLDPLDVDVPEGCWSLQLVDGRTLVILKSVYWPGMVFYHKMKTNKYGSVYIGHGKKCLDIPFMLPPI